MSNHFLSTRPVSLLAVFLLLLVLLACRCSRPGPDSSGSGDNRPTPSTPTLSPSPISEAKLQRHLTSVEAGEAEPLRSLSDNRWHNISGATRVRTDENGEGWLQIRDCMLIYLFQVGQMTTAPCSKSEYASGHANCQLSGTAVYNDSCGPQAQQLVETPSANIAPRGTWFSVTYLPQQEATLVMVFDGSVTITPVKDLETRSLGEPTTIEAGQVWVTAPDNRLNTDADNIGGTERKVMAVSDYKSVIRAVVGPWLDRIRQRAKEDGIEGPSIEALALPSPSLSPSLTTPEITSEADIDCDCQNISAGLLTRAYQRECLQIEANLKSQFREAKRVIGRCHSVASGPNAKPK
jgi:hypothetical protein